ncbi:MAG: penicillin-binding transpeptidase domain-containing protein [Anaerolineales bacterium]
MKRTSLVPVLLLITLSACSLFSGGSPEAGVTPTLPEPVQTTEPAPDPNSAAHTFLDAWVAGDYERMYAMLTPDAQAANSLEDFSQIYVEVGDALAASQIDYELVSALVASPARAEVRFRVTLHSAVLGPFTRETRMDLERDSGEGWRVAWTHATVLPELESGNRLDLQIVNPTRANIYDRNDQALAVEPPAGQDNVAGLWIVPNRIGDEAAEESMLSTLRRLFNLASTDPILERYDNIRNTDWFVPLGEVPFEDYQTVGGLLASVGGVQPYTYAARYYYGSGLTPFAGGVAPHAVGYVGQIQAEELEQRLKEGYAGDEYIGRIGIEQVYEDELRGQPGGTLYLTDADGNRLQVIESREPEPPYAVYTTLNRDLQEVAQRSLEGFSGAVVVLERDTGAVLAMASSPAFDPNLFNPQNPNRDPETFRLLDESNQPYVNRAVQGLYPAGSTFKIITMAAALESGLFEPDTVYDCPHQWTEVPGYTLDDWTLDHELPASGELTLQEGLMRSCNPWFYHIGYTLFQNGMGDLISKMAEGFGLGQPTGIEIGDEAGTVPSPETKLERLGEEWDFRDPVQLAIGQNFLEVTPLQMARYVAAVGNGGTLYQPQLVQRVQNAEGDVLQQFAAVEQGTLPISAETLAAIQEALVMVVDNPRGTAYRRMLGLNLNIAGKTGTATTTGLAEPHGWFAGYSFENREDKPDIAIAVIIENIGDGSDWAAPIFRRLMETYFKGRPIQPFPWEARLWVERTPEPEEGEATPSP